MMGVGESRLTPGRVPRPPGSFPPRTSKEEYVFDKSKAKVTSLIDDKVTVPVRTGILIACAAFVLAGLAFILVLVKR